MIEKRWEASCNGCGDVENSPLAGHDKKRIQGLLEKRSEMEIQGDFALLQRMSKKREL